MQVYLGMVLDKKKAHTKSPKYHDLKFSVKTDKNI